MAGTLWKKFQNGLILKSSQIILQSLHVVYFDASTWRKLPQKQFHVVQRFADQKKHDDVGQHKSAAAILQSCEREPAESLNFICFSFLRKVLYLQTFPRPTDNEMHESRNSMSFPHFSFSTKSVIWFTKFFELSWQLDNVSLTFGITFKWSADVLFVTASSFSIKDIWNTEITTRNFYILVVTSTWISGTDKSSLICPFEP